MKIMTVVGTRPEIIRLACVIRRLEKFTDHVLVHTGQNYDHQLSQVFLDDLGLRQPDHFLDADTSSLGAMLGDVIKGTEAVIHQERPDAMVVLGDTNSCIAAVIGRRLKVPVFHLEAGNRSFDPNVPEEINRHLVDHVSDYNLVYTEHSRRNLIAEGVRAEDVMVMGSPMLEILTTYRDQIEASDVLEHLELTEGEYLLASLHREENVDREDRLTAALAALQAVATAEGVPCLVSTHPRTKKRIEAFGLDVDDRLRMHPPLGFHDYNKLQLNARCVISDSGTISEESSILGFPAVTLRDAIERPEALETGAIIATGLEANDVVDAVQMTITQHREEGPATIPAEYQIADSSRRVVNFIRSKVGTHRLRKGIRR
ncbi:non-hydrolyzing UDP-N-acetylglucosamine 2-epimerase [Citricoccus muralis]|uniref:UDP-N-acetylglucosamine 2-epimerase (Non-hydrolyzing) n=1 Tax=Citricoccus muralis TaxID=169134 RepID=A0ABY8H954_9MICC|nr:UDP-N-acetylglucosamine 2-epimerase (non-hydrolyzing) [Citricoccus muralis]WFP17163.1 UDP-N-acetylglucosamine 2-epimerase (non-hydrolyzing) [Citricoccus muralis]